MVVVEMGTINENITYLIYIMKMKKRRRKRKENNENQ